MFWKNLKNLQVYQKISKIRKVENKSIETNNYAVTFCRPCNRFPGTCEWTNTKKSQKNFKKPQKNCRFYQKTAKIRDIKMLKTTPLLLETI